MTRLFRLLLFVCLFCGCLAACAQSSEKDLPVIEPHRTVPAKPKPAPATLLVVCDLPCTLKVDGHGLGHLNAEGSTHTAVELGQHAVVATSEDGLDTARGAAEVKSAGQTVFMVALKPVRAERLKAQSESDFQQGRSLVELKRYAEALPLLRQSCEAGNPGGCSWLGRCYDKGFGVAVDNQQARQLYGKGCDGGSLRGCVGLGYLDQRGLGGPVDNQRARTLFERGCDGGEMLGCNNLGVLYGGGLGVTQDYARALQLYQKACDGGEMLGCSNVGVSYAVGHGVTRDYATANRFFTRACQAGQPVGCYRLGMAYDNGSGVAQNKSQAALYYRRACDDGEPRACEAAHKLH